jgi:hypothetical protein
MKYSDLISELTTRRATKNSSLRSLANTFARDFGWRPSDYAPAPDESVANAHLLVEHGLKNTAVITFLYTPVGREGVTANDIQRLLSFSYNNQPDRLAFDDQR